MGLSAFSRARVSMLPELELEAARFEQWNQTHQESFRALDELHSSEEAEEAIVEIREAMLAGVHTIGEKVVEGLAENTPEGEGIDLPLRYDHVRDMVGRRHVEDPQGEPKTTLERLHDRIPTEAPDSEVIVEKTDVIGEGPTRIEMEKAYQEQEPWTGEPEDPEINNELPPDPHDPTDPDPPDPTDPIDSRRGRTELPEPGDGAGVMSKGAGVNKQPGPVKDDAHRIKEASSGVKTTGAAKQGTERSVPKTTAAADPKQASKPATEENKK